MGESALRVIAGRARHIPLQTVPGQTTRPTQDRIKETLFNILQPQIAETAFLDLFSGSGGIGIEALSRGARRAVFIEQDPRAASCIRANLKKTRLEEAAQVLPVSVSAGLKRLSGQGAFDIVFMDPPYRKGLDEEALRQLSGSDLITPETLLIVEAPLDQDLRPLEDAGYRIVRRKEYKTNQHVFLQPVSERDLKDAAREEKE